MRGCSGRKPMYLGFYGLTEKPFNTTPDPKFLFLTPGHREALAQLVYGVREEKGFIAVTGDVGTGKTTMLRALLQRLNGTSAVAFVAHATLAFDGLLEYILEDFGIATAEHSPAQRLVAFNRFLIERQRAGQTTLLILDEAQNLDASMLERVRLLSNFESPTHKLLQIILAGQPELVGKLQLPELRQLKQRVGLLCRVPRLTSDETRQYIRTRLRIAGAGDLSLFSEQAVARIAAYADGVPRLINLVCDHSLVLGYAEQRRKIDRDLVDQAIRYFKEGGAVPRRRLRMTGRGVSRVPRWAVGALGAALAGLSLATVAPDLLGDVSTRFAQYATQLWHSVAGFVLG